MQRSHVNPLPTKMVRMAQSPRVTSMQGVNNIDNQTCTLRFFKGQGQQGIFSSVKEKIQFKTAESKSYFIETKSDFSTLQSRTVMESRVISKEDERNCWKSISAQAISSIACFDKLVLLAAVKL